MTTIPKTVDAERHERGIERVASAIVKMIDSFGQRWPDDFANRLAVAAIDAAVLGKDDLARRIEQIVGDYVDLTDNRYAQMMWFVTQEITAYTQSMGTAGTVGQHGEYNIQAISKVISLSYGEDPDEDAPLGKICGPNNEPLPCWMAYEEQAKAVFTWMMAVIDNLEAMGTAGTVAQEPVGEDDEAAIALGAAVLTRIEDPAVREAAIRNALRAALSSPQASDPAPPAEPASEVAALVVRNAGFAKLQEYFLAAEDVFEYGEAQAPTWMIRRLHASRAALAPEQEVK